MTIRHIRSMVGRDWYWALILLALTLAQSLFALGLTTLRLYQYGPQFFFNLFAIRLS